MNSYKLEIPRAQFDRIADAFEQQVFDVNGYVPMDIRFAPFTFDVLSCTPTDGRSEKPFEMKPSELVRY